jgi:hypothetical protein
VEHGKAASVTLKITLKPQTKYAGDVVEITDDLAAKVPQAARGAALFFTDSVGGLSRTNPNQPQLPLREVPRKEATA